MEEGAVFCCRCQAALTMQKVSFSYLGQIFSTELLACPQCRQAYVPEDVARGKMAETEAMLEDK